VGHERLEHFPKSVAFWGRGKKDVSQMKESWRQMVDDEIEAEMYSYRVMGKKVTPRVGIMALRELIQKGWMPYRALSLVIGRLGHYGIHTTMKEREDLIGILERASGEEISWKL